MSALIDKFMIKTTVWCHENRIYTVLRWQRAHY